MNKTKGFTLVELIIVIVIVSILSMVAVPVYKRNVKKAMGTEAKALIGAILTAEKVYYAEYDTYRYTNRFDDTHGIINRDRLLDIDSRANKYFTGWLTDGENLGESGAYLIIAVIGNQGSGADSISMAYITYTPEFEHIFMQQNYTVGFYEAYDAGELQNIFNNDDDGD